MNTSNPFLYSPLFRVLFPFFFSSILDSPTFPFRHFLHSFLIFVERFFFSFIETTFVELFFLSYFDPSSDLHSFLLIETTFVELFFLSYFDPSSDLHSFLHPA